MGLTKTYTIEIDGQKSLATVGQIKEQIARLEAEIDNATLGTQELEAKMLELGRAKGALKELEDAVDALDPKAQAGAYLDFANGVTGAFGVASVAAENFGLASAGSAEEVEKKMLQLLTVMQSFEAIHKALNSETQAAMKNMLTSSMTNLKAILGLGNGWTLAGIKAKLFGTTTRAALTAAGIGIFLVLLGTIIAHWDSITKKVGEFKESIARYFPAIGQLVDGVVAKLRDIAGVLSFGFIDDAATAAVKRAEAQEKKATEARIANRKRLIAEVEAAGRSTYNLKQQQLSDELSLLEKGSAEYADKLSEIRVLKNGHDKSLADAAEKAAKEAADKRKAEAEKYKQQAAKEAEEAYNAMRKAEADEYTAREAARAKRYNMAKALGADEAVLLQIELDNLNDAQQDLLDQGQRFSAEWYAIEAQKLEKQKAIRAAEKAEQENALAEKERLHQQELDNMDAQYQKQRVLLTQRHATVEEFTELELSHLKARAVALEKAGKQYTKEYEEILKAIGEIEGRVVEKKGGVLQKIFDGLFGHLTEKQQEIVQQQLASILENSLYVADSLLQEAFAKLDTLAEALDERLTEVQDRNQEIDNQLNDTLQRREELEDQLADARGAKREYLIQQIAKERLEESRLAAEKKKAAAEEAKIKKQQEEAEKKRQELEAKGRLAQEAGMAITQAATAFDAVAAAVAAVKSGSSVPFPGNLVAIGAGIAAVAAAVVSAKKLAASVKVAKFEQGGSPNEVSGEVKGPSHAEGGVPFTVKGVPGYEMEGDEFIVRKTAYANNRETIQKINAIGNSVRFVAIPENQIRRRASGGESGTGAGAASGSVAMVGGEASLTAEDIAAIRAVLSKIETNTARAADKELAFPDPWQSRVIVSQARQVVRDEQSGKLF